MVSCNLSGSRSCRREGVGPKTRPATRSVGAISQMFRPLGPRVAHGPRGMNGPERQSRVSSGTKVFAPNHWIFDQTKSLTSKELICTITVDGSYDVRLITRNLLHKGHDVGIDVLERWMLVAHPEQSELVGWWLPTQCNVVLNLAHCNNKNRHGSAAGTCTRGHSSPITRSSEPKEKGCYWYLHQGQTPHIFKKNHA